MSNLVSSTSPTPRRPAAWRGLVRLLLWLLLPACGSRAAAATLPARVGISPPGGMFTNTLTVSLASPIPGATIFYTTNGSLPTNTSRVYTGPFTVAASTRLRTVLFLTNTYGPVESAYYVRVAADLRNFSSPLPIMVLENFGSGSVPQDTGRGPYGDGSYVNEMPYQPVAWGILDRATNGRASFSGPLDLLHRAGVRVRGSSSVNYVRKAYSVETWDEANRDDNTTPLGLPPESDWVLYAPTPEFDYPLIHNSFIYAVARSAGFAASRTRFVELFLNTDGGDLRLADYAGLYLLAEKVKRGPDRVDFEPLSADGRAGGWMLAVDRMDPRPLENPNLVPRHFHAAGPDGILQTEDDNLRGYQGTMSSANGLPPVRDDRPEVYYSFFNFDDPGGYVVNAAQRAQIQNYIRQLDAAVFGPNFADPASGYAAFIDVDNWIDHYLFHNLAHNQDALVLSTFLYRPTPQSRLRFGPIWDFDRAYNHNPTNIDPTRNLYWAGTRLWLGRLFTDPNFQQRYVDRWQTLRRGALSTSNLLAVVERQTNEITAEVAVRHGLTNWPQRVGELRSWLQLRVSALDAQFVPPPVLSLPGGPVAPGTGIAITTSLGVIYYTLDGTDPRGFNGTVAPSARNYAGPVGIVTSTQIRARARHGVAWSGLTEAFYLPPQDLSALAVTELMYHPPDNGDVSGDEYEFLELKNTGTVPLDLAGLTFESGLDYTFPAGARLDAGGFWVLVRNPAEFARRHPGVAHQGAYDGRLDNGGETVALSFSGGGRILTVSYEDRPPWPLAADGHGFSLVPRLPSPPGNSDRGIDYRASARAGGSPGADDPTPGIVPVVINEILANSPPPMVDAVELFNPTGTNADLGGWFLSDDAAVPRKFRFSTGTVIPAHGFLVLSEADFNPPAATTNAFSLNSRGEMLSLWSGDGTNLTGYTDAVEFGASPAGVPLGRVVLSTGEAEFTLQTVPSPGTSNAAPRVGPVIISEIHYHPAAGGAEFVELQNTGDSPVPLFDAQPGTNTWQLGGLGYRFPPGITLQPGQRLLLVDSHPAAFRIDHAVPDDVVILGPFTGQLQDSGERLELLRPEPPDAVGVPYVAVDAVRYNDHLPWPPAADGGGASLHRRSPPGVGSDPVNWIAATPSPGRPTPAGSAPVITGISADTNALAGQSLTLGVAATGSPTLFHQWRFNGGNLPGGTADTLVINPVTFESAGTYEALVFNAAGSALSPPVQVAVRQPATIFTQPRDVIVTGSTNPAAYGVTGSNVTFRVEAFSTSPLRYQWQFNATNLPRMTNASLTVSNVNLSHEGLYRVLLTDDAGTLASSNATLVVHVPPVILTAPPSQGVVAGGTAVFGVEARGHPGPLSFDWRRLSTLLRSNAPGGTRDFLTLTNLAAAQAGAYRVFVRTPVSTASALVQWNLTVLADTDGDGIPDVWEQRFGYNPTNALDASLDADGDGMTTLSEYQAGTVPTNAASRLQLFVREHTSSRVVLEFNAASNLTYAVDYRDRLDSAPWTRLADIPGGRTNRVERVIDAGAVGNRFYRLSSPWTP